MKSKLPLLPLLAFVLLLLLPSNLMATIYCNEPITSNTGKNATFSCESLGSDQYRFTLVSEESVTSISNINFGCNPGPVNIGASLSLQADNKTITGEFTCTGAPSIYVAIMFLMYSSGEARFDIPLDAEFSVCGDPDPTPPTIGDVTVVSSYNGNAELAFSVAGSAPITYAVTCDGNTIPSGDYAYSSGKLKINSSYFTVGTHSVNITATNSEGSDSKTGIVVNTSAEPQKCGTVIGTDGSSIDYLFITNPDNSVTITISATANVTNAIVYIGGPGYTMQVNGKIATYTHPASLIGAQTQLSDVYFLYNIGGGEQNTSANKVNYTIGTICYDNESPQWVSNPSFVAASARSFVLDVNVSDDVAIKGFNVKLGTCESVNVQITATVLYDGSISVSLPAGCSDLPSDAGSAKSATIEAYDAAGNVSISKTVGGIYKTITPPTMVSASCMDPIGTTTMTMAVSATNGTNNVKAYQVVSSSPAYSGTFTPSAGKILLTGLAGNTSYVFDVWAVDDMDVLSENYVTCSANCKTLDPNAPDVPSKLTATPMERTSTGTCSTSIVAGTNFAASTYAEDTYNLSYSDIVTAEGRLSNLSINSILQESYVNGGFHDVPSSYGEYAIVSNPKVLNGKYPAKSDGKNRFIAGFSTTLNTGNRLNIMTYTFEPLIQSSKFKVSFKYDDMNTAAVGARQLWIVIKEGESVLVDTYLDYSAGSENTYTSAEFTLSGANQKVSVQIDARMLPVETTVAISDLIIYGCVTKSIAQEIDENYVCRGTSVNLRADGFGTGTGFTWYSGSTITGPWTILPASNTSTITVTPEIVGNNYYRVVNGSDEATTSVLAKVCCDVSGESQQKIVWTEIFGTSLDPNERYTNRAVDSIAVYTFATKENTCGGAEGLGKVCDGYYVVVSNSTAAYAHMCGWPSGKFDHTTSDGTGGYLIVNAGTENKLLYEKEIYPEGGFCSGIWYNFSLYATNIAPSGSSPARFTLEIIEKRAGGVEIELSNFDTGNIEGFSMSQWFNYGTSFTPSDFAEQIVVRIWNTGGSTNGNDLVLDDLSVSICQPKAGIFIGDIADKKKEETEISCGTTVSLSAVLNGYQADFFSSTPYYLWTMNTGSGWTEISGASGIGVDGYSHMTQDGVTTQVKTILAGDRETALKVLNGEEVGSCSSNAVTDVATVSCKNNCPNPATIIWKSDSGKQNQTVCSGESMISSRYELGGSATDYTIEGLPSYMTHSKTGSIIEISGIPTENINYTITTTGQDAGCTPATISGIITYAEKPTASINGDSNELTCSKTSIELNSETNATNPTYLWSNGAITSSIDVSAADDYTVTITDQSNGCSAESSTVTITESGDKPQASINAAATKLTCAVLSIQLEAQTDAQNVSYLWSNGSIDQSINVTDAGSYYVTITNTDNGCSSTSSSIEITEDKTVPSASISSTSTELNCLTNSITLTSSTDASNVDYLWSNGAVSKDLDITEAGTYSVQITNTDNSCATTSNEIEITENKKQPTVDINPKSGSLTCDEPTLVLTLSTDAVTPQYLWSNGTAESTLTASTGGNYYVTVTDASNGCSVQSETVSITDEKTYPSLTIVPANPVLTCTQTTVILEAQADNVTYLWSDFSTSSTIEVSEAQEYSVTITDITTGCTNTASVVVTESTDKPNVQISSQETVLTCKTTSIVLTAEANNVTYLWNDGSADATLNVDEVGIYTVTVTDITNGCQNSASSEEITENIEVPQVSITAPETEITCQNQKVVLTAETQNNVDYLWDDNSSLETRDILAAGSNYWVEVTDKENGCVGRADAPIITDVREMLDFDLQLSNEEVVLGNEATVEVNVTSGDYNNVIWQRNGEIFVPSDELQSTEKPYIDVTYTITLEGDCNTISKEAIVKVLWPTAFTPYNTSSNLNRTFVTDMNPNFPIIVYTRYGNKILESPNGWDGTCAGQMCMPGVYYYQVSLPNGEIKKGTVELYKE